MASNATGSDTAPYEMSSTTPKRTTTTTTLGQRSARSSPSSGATLHRFLKRQGSAGGSSASVKACTTAKGPSQPSDQRSATTTTTTKTMFEATTEDSDVVCLVAKESKGNATGDASTLDLGSSPTAATEPRAALSMSGAADATIQTAPDRSEASSGLPVSAYATWVSEVMLQQTRVEAVIAFYERWMKRFPTVQALADASPDDVNAAWAGLGYYRRARLLHAGAKAVVEQHSGELPSSVEGLRSLPGIGEYTAGAIASIAFGRRAALVDGNVIRVMARLFGVALDAKSPVLHRLCWCVCA